MKTTVNNALLVFIGSISTAFAANGVENAEHSIALYLFIGFGVLIVLFQAVPGFMLFFSMLKGLITSKKETAEEKSEKAS